MQMQELRIESRWELKLGIAFEKLRGKLKKNYISAPRPSFNSQYDPANVVVTYKISLNLKIL